MLVSRSRRNPDHDQNLRSVQTVESFITSITIINLHLLTWKPDM